MMQQSLNKVHSQGQGDPVSVYGSQVCMHAKLVLLNKIICHSTKKIETLCSIDSMKLCQSVSNIFRNPAQMYSPPATIQSVSGEEMFKLSPNDAINV